VIIKKQPLISCTRIDKRNRNSIQRKHKTYELESKSKAPRAQGGKGLLSQTNSVQSLKIHGSNPREERRNKEIGREEGGARRRGRLLLLGQARRERG